MKNISLPWIIICGFLVTLPFLLFGKGEWKEPPSNENVAPSCPSQMPERMIAQNICPKPTCPQVQAPSVAPLKIDDVPVLSRADAKRRRLYLPKPPPLPLSLGGNHDTLVDSLKETLRRIEAFRASSPQKFGPEHLPNRWAANLGANTGKDYDPVYPFFLDGYSGVAVEIAQTMQAALHANLPWERVKKVRSAVTPSNVVDLLIDAGSPRGLDIFKIDIDSHDVFVVRDLLRNGTFKPKVIVMEINESIPPPICFTSNFARSFAWSGQDAFTGASISMMDHQLSSLGYTITTVEWNNIILVSDDFADAFPLYNPADLWLVGYYDRAKRIDRFPWNEAPDRVAYQTNPDPYEAMRIVSDYMISSSSYKNSRTTFSLYIHPDYVDTLGHSLKTTHCENC